MNTLNNNNQKGEAMTTEATTTTTKKVVRKFHQDPGHGWLCVKISDDKDQDFCNAYYAFDLIRNDYHLQLKDSTWTLCK